PWLRGRAAGGGRRARQAGGRSCRSAGLRGTCRGTPAPSRSRAPPGPPPPGGGVARSATATRPPPRPPRAPRLPPQSGRASASSSRPPGLGFRFRPSLHDVVVAVDRQAVEPLLGPV